MRQLGSHFRSLLPLLRVSLKMGRFTTESGKMRSDKASVFNNGVTGLFMKGFGIKTKRTEEASLFTLMEMSTRATG